MTAITNYIPTNQQHLYLNYSQDCRIPDNDCLTRWKMTSKEFISILEYIDKMPRPLENTVIKRAKSGLSFSIACILKADSVAHYILFKEHRISKLADGGFCRITLAWDIENGIEKAFRSASLDSMHKNEKLFLKQLSSRPDLYMASPDSIEYIGSCEKRNAMESCLNHLGLTKPKNYPANKNKYVPKVGLLLELGKCSLYGLMKLSGRRLQDAGVNYYIAKSILDGLTYMHEQGIVHLDLKLQNIIITHDGFVKIADFGLAGHSTSEATFDDIRHYHAPEIIEAVNAKEWFQVDPASDIWSYGVILFELFSREKLDRTFYREEIDELKNETIRSEVFDFELDPIVSLEKGEDPVTNPVKSLFDECCRYEPELRKNAKDAAVALAELSVGNEHIGPKDLFRIFESSYFLKIGSNRF